jgi:hypothetical protein
MHMAGHFSTPIDNLGPTGESSQMTACIAVIAFNGDRVGFTDDVTLRR